MRLKTVEPQSLVGTDFRHCLTKLCDIGALVEVDTDAHLPVRIDGLQSPLQSFNAYNLSTLPFSSRGVRLLARAVVAGARAEYNSIQHEPGMNPKKEGARRSFDGRRDQGR